MHLRMEVLAAILLCALVTQIPRIAPFLISHRVRMPARMVAWLRLMSPAILSTLLVPMLLFDSASDLKTARELVIVAVSCAVTVLAFRLRRRSLATGFIAGLACFAALTHLASA